MTSWTAQFRQVLDAAKNISENDAQILAEFERLTWEQWQSLLALRTEGAEQSLTIRLMDEASGDGFDLLDEDFELGAGPYKLMCTKAPVEAALRFIFWSHFEVFASRTPSAVEAVAGVFVSDITVSIRDSAFQLVPWVDAKFDLALHPGTPRPVNVVNDATGAGTVPLTLAPWFTLATHTAESSSLRGTAARRMAMSLASSIYRNGEGSLSALVDLKRKTRAQIENDDDPIWISLSDERLGEAARWVYAEGNDTENRHSLLSAEIARAFPRGQCWFGGLLAVLPAALDSAKIAYRLHLYDKSIDALKLMSDLRKGLSDDVKAVSAQTTGLASGLWRDAAVAVGAVAFKYLSGSLGMFVLLLTAAYLLVSWYLNRRVASKAVSAIRANEQIFREKLFLPLLTSDEYSEIAGSRYVAVLQEFKIYSRLVTATYAAAIFVVVAAAYSIQLEYVFQAARVYLSSVLGC